MDRTHEEQPARRPPGPQRADAHEAGGPADALLGLQRGAGNQAVSRAVAGLVQRERLYSAPEINWSAKGGKGTDAPGTETQGGGEEATETETEGGGGEAPGPSKPGRNRPTTGSVKWYDTQKGYGLIESATGEEVQVRHSDVPSSIRVLEPGMLLSFTPQHGPKGSWAENVSLLR